ncbi:MAG TPA: efflux RND transporter periplasmic adaptor subunit [Gemmataceae bacterium]|jgi:multidrug resistance efflux pump|nr:efflux RND transporter periplasmic adaptor subunit [Gemmataceae bacterium]
MQRLPRKIFWGIGLAGVMVIGALIVIATGVPFWRNQARAETLESFAQEPSGQDDMTMTVRTICPKCDPSFSLSIKAPAQIVPYEWADLEAQVAGRVEFIRKAEGAPVTDGELLVKIAVPDLEQEVKQKESIIRQRQADLALAQANEKIAQKTALVAAKSIEVEKAGVEAADGMLNYRTKEFNRLRGLVEDKAATQQVVEEHELLYKATRADLTKAKANVLKAEADLEQARAKLDAAAADVHLKGELIEVARKDRDHAQAMADYAGITAPFDGVVTRRNVNRGSFVQNATTAHTIPLMRVERRDIVTVTMRVPDTFASLVTNNTEAVIEMSEFPGLLIHGKVSRFSPSLEREANDHTLPVQVDLFNGTDEEYQKFLSKEKARKVPFDDLKEGPLPIIPTITGTRTDVPHRMYPGMYGEMHLVFRELSHVFLIPSDAIVRPGGTPYIYLVKNGKAALVPVEVQVDDQHLAKVAIITKTSTGVVKRNLTGEEQVIYSNQGELTDGEAVKAIPQDWTP